MELIDSHCHLAKFQAEGVLDEVLDRAAAQDVSACIAVGTSEEDWIVYERMAKAYPQVHYTLGLHPCYVPEDNSWETSVNQLASFFTPGNPPVALGEIGLDHFHLPKDPIAAGKQIIAQEEAFKRQLAIAYQLDCPVIVHSRDSFDECVRCIDESGVNWERVVFHCFSGDTGQIQRLRQRGGRGSFTGIVTYKNAASVREALYAQGLDVLMLETDSPYLAPVPHRGQRNEPAYLRAMVEPCAEAFDLSVEAFAEKVTENTREFFGI